MKANFEKGTKICPRCRKEFPINCFYKNKSECDGLNVYCKECNRVICKQQYRKDIEYSRIRSRNNNDKRVNTFQRECNVRGNNGMLKRDYELTEEQLKRRERSRKDRIKRYKGRQKQGVYGILIWYDGKLNNLSSKEYTRVMNKEYNRQRICAIRGYIGRTQPSEHFLFDFDLEQMLKDNVYFGDKKRFITKWWKGEIRYWTVNDGIWRE